MTLTSQLYSSEIHHELLQVGILNRSALGRLVSLRLGEVSKPVGKEDPARIFLDLDQESNIIFLKETLCEVGMHVITVVYMDAEVFHL